MSTTCYWDEEAGEQRERDCTPEEESEIAARRNAGPMVPESVPMLNAELVLISAGYWDDVQAFVKEQGAVAVAFLNRAQTMRRDNALVNAWAAARGKSGELDGLFIEAAALNPDAYHG
jgi:hypothetical protein